jgi:polar amino acid transport system substrate-binding protein
MTSAISRSTRRAWLPALVVFLAACGVAPTMTSMPSSAARAQLAPSGTLRAAINFGNPVLASRDPATGAPRGVSVDLARELARRLGVEARLVTYDTAGKVVDAVKAGEWDIAFVAIDPVRGADMDYSAPYVIIEGAYAVPDGSPIRSNDEVDRAGNRIVVGKGSAYDLYLTREIRRAQLVRAPSSQVVVDTMAKERGSRGGRQAAAAVGPEAHPGGAAARRPLHGHQPGDGDAEGAPRRRPLSARVRRGDEGNGIRRRRAESARHRRRVGGPAGDGPRVDVTARLSASARARPGRPR